MATECIEFTYCCTGLTIVHFTSQQRTCSELVLYTEMGDHSWVKSLDMQPNTEAHSASVFN